MDRTPQWRDEIKRRLTQEGLPLGYVDRLVREWNDHCRDLSEAGQQRPYEQLGTTNDLVNAATASFRSRTLLGRRPLVGFLGGPVVLAAISWIGYFGFFLAIMGFAFESLGQACREQIWMAQCIFLGGKVIPPMLAAGMFTWLASRSGRPFRWLAGSLAMLCLFCFFGPTAQLSMPSASKPEGVLSLGFPFLFENVRQVLGQLIQAMVALVTAGIVWIAIRRVIPHAVGLE